MAWAQPDSTNFLNWFPKADCRSVAEKLSKRILFSGHLLPILTALAFSILAEIYTTTSDGDREYRRARLKYKTSPIKDFGVAKGAVAVADDHLLAYRKLSDGSIVRGQDPNEHYWLWFKTIRDQEVILDLGMFTFDMCTMVETEGHVPPNMAFQVPLAPAYFFDRDMRKQGREAPIQAELHDRQHCTRYSVLYDEDLAEAVTHSHDRANVYPEDIQCMRSFMKRVSGRNASREESFMVYELSQIFGKQLEQDYLRQRLWETSPPSPRLAIHHDPGEGNTFYERCRNFWGYSLEQLSRPSDPTPRHTDNLEQEPRELWLLADLLGRLSINLADLWP
ncbi:hypothetical protein EIP86_003700 [Pleurotus ostreatoroseus]|nr:hypothetical protein EIP86_003700 [Pleurotus ostreatoroseus]